MKILTGKDHQSFSFQLEIRHALFPSKKRKGNNKCVSQRRGEKERIEKAGSSNGIRKNGSLV